MMRKLTVNKMVIAGICMLLVGSSLYGQEEREYIRKGNRLYKKNEYAGSEGMYRRAQTPESSFEDASFNLGDALYKQGRFGEATEEFTRTVTSARGDSLKKAEGLYNLGNSLLKEKKFGESIEAYINSLKIKPDNLQAKYNLAYAQDQLKKQEEQQKQNQDQEKNKDQNDKNKDNKQNNDNQDKKDDQKDQQQQDQQNQQQQQQDQQQQQQDQQQQPSISREDAKRLLDALAANEKETKEKVQRDKAANARVRVIKNW